MADLGGGGGVDRVWLTTPQNSLKNLLAGKVPIIIDNAITLTNSRNFT